VKSSANEFKREWITPVHTARNQENLSVARRPCFAAMRHANSGAPGIPGEPSRRNLARGSAACGERAQTPPSNDTYAKTSAAVLVTVLCSRVRRRARQSTRPLHHMTSLGQSSPPTFLAIVGTASRVSAVLRKLIDGAKNQA
jgi:hypothetical protein